MNAMEPALVVIVNNKRDWQRVIEQGWYRVPLKHAPTPLAASYLAFYFTRVFGDDVWQVRFYAPVLRYQIATRAELFTMEATHPRADARYYRIDVGL